MLKQFNLRYIVISTLLASVLLLISCGPTPSVKNVSGPGQPKFGGTAIIGFSSEPDNIMPNLSASNGVRIDAAIWAPLFYGDNTGVIRPGIASEVPSLANGGISPDFKTYTIHLRPGLKWSDGTPETADDVVFSLKLYANPAYGGVSGFPGNEITSIRATESSTVVIVLNKVDVTFLADQLTDPAAAPIPQSIYGSMSPSAIAKSQQAFQPPVVSGPFMFKERIKGDHMTLVKNPHYYLAPRPYLDSVIFKFLPDQNTILAALESGSIDAASFLDINHLEAYRAIQGYHVVVTKELNNIEQLYFNLHNHFLADLQVRKAITMGIDTTPLMKNIWKGLASPTCDDANGTYAHEPSLIPCYKYDPAEAKALLEADGFIMGNDGYFAKNGATLELRYSTTSGNLYRMQTQQILQQQLKQIGIKIDIVDYPSDTLFGSIIPKEDFDLVEFFWGLGYDPDDHYQWDCNQTQNNAGFNITNFCDPNVDIADKTQLSNPDPSLRKAALHIVHVELLKQIPVMFLYAFPSIACAKSVIQNYVNSPFGPGATWNLWDWWRSDAPGQ